MDAKVLIVDDSPEMIDILRDIIPQDIKKQVALNGTNALKLLNSSDDLPDLILLDIVMPGIDGFQVCRMIKSVNRFEEIPIIFISSLDESFDKVKAFELGAVDYITKPFNREEVLARIHTHLELHQSKTVIKELYSETIQGTIGAMNDVLAITNPEVANFSNTLKFYAERIMRKLKLYNVWDLKLACVLSGLGMLSENLNKEVFECGLNENLLTAGPEVDTERTYESLALSKEIISKIPRFEAVIQIIDEAMSPLKDECRNVSPQYMEQSALKGQILRLLIFYLYQYEEDTDHLSHMNIIEEMKRSTDEFYCPYVLDALAEVENDLSTNKIYTVSVNQLQPQMILVEDLYCPNGRLILKAGYQLSEQLIMLVKNFKVTTDIRVEVIQS